MGQIPFLVVFLFALGEGKGTPTFGTSDFKVWHGAFLHQSRTEVSALMLLGGPLSSFLSAWLVNCRRGAKESFELLR
jgi:hypothetical protein